MLSETIQSRLKERFTAPLPEFYERRIIFWIDEDSQFADQIDGIDLPAVNIIKLTGRNNFSVKRLLSADDLTGDYLVYDPLSYTKGHEDDWLLDVKLYSEEFRADLVSLQMEELNIEDQATMRRTVKMYAKFLENKERKAKLRRIGTRYKSASQFHIDILTVLCGLNGGTSQDVIIAVLLAGLDYENNKALTTIEKFGDINIFWQMVQTFTGYVHDDSRPLSDFAAHILVTALSQSMSVTEQDALNRFISKEGITYCYQLVHEWQRNEHANDLLEVSRLVEEKLRLMNRFDGEDLKDLLRCDTFPAINESILKRLLTDISEGVIKVDTILQTVENRRTAAWYQLTQDYFECLYYIGKIQEFYLEHIDGFHLVNPSELWKLYTTDAYRMDHYYRHYLRTYAQALKVHHPFLEDSLKCCTDVVEGLYNEWFLKELTQSWTDAIAGDLATSGTVSDISEQRRFFSQTVYPNVRKGNRVFVIISDALRYEVAAELCESLSLNTKGKATLNAMQSVLPGITKFGMAALLPGKEISVDEKMNVLVDQKATGSTAQREAILREENVNSVAIGYKALLEMKQQERRDLIAGMEIVYIYHNSIDAVGDKLATEVKVFEACDTAIEELTSTVKIIVNDLSGTSIFITSDHGFLYTHKPLQEIQKIDRQVFTGDIYELGRRYALVPSTTTAEYLMPIRADQMFGGTPMSVYAPRDTIRMKIQGGGQNYVHGGVSLQEMVVPLISYKGMRSSNKKYEEVQNPGLQLISENHKISNLLFSLDFFQKEAVGEKVQPSTYYLQFIDEESNPVSDRQIVIADRKNTNASERVFRVRFTLKQMQYDRNKTYHLVIKNDTDLPEMIEYSIDIAFADDFGFGL